MGLLEKLPVEDCVRLSVPLALKEGLWEVVGDTLVVPTSAPCRLGERLSVLLCEALCETLTVPLLLPAAPCSVGDTEIVGLSLPPALLRVGV